MNRLMGSFHIFLLFFVDLLTLLVQNDATSFLKHIVFPNGKQRRPFPFHISLPKWEQRRPALTFSSTPFWLTFFSCDLFLLVPRVAALDFL